VILFSARSALVDEFSCVYIVDLMFSARRAIVDEFIDRVTLVAQVWECFQVKYIYIYVYIYMYIDVYTHMLIYAYVV